MTVVAEQHEQTRARYPDEEGFVERDGVRVFYEVYGSGVPTVLLLPTWALIHSRHWKLQIPCLARHCRVVTFDGRGNGRSDRPQGAEAYAIREFAADTLAVMDATATERAVVVGVSCAALWGVVLAAEHPERVAGAAFIGPAVPLAPPLPERTVYPFDERLDTDEGWAKYNMHHWLRDYRDFLEFFIGKCFTEPHSTKPIEDADRLGARDDPRSARGPRRRHRPADRRRLQGALRARSLSGARHARRRGRAPLARAGRGARRGDGRAARHAPGLRTLSAGAGSGDDQPAPS